MTWRDTFYAGAVGFVLWTALASAGAVAREYVPTLTQADWETDGNRIECRLAQHIPAYGQGVFVRRAGGELTFRVQVQRGPQGEGQAELRSEPPLWRHGLEPQRLGKLRYGPGPTPFELSGRRAHLILAQLEQGRFPTIGYDDWARPGQRVRVAFSAVRFRPALERFLDCTDELVQLSFDQARKTVIRFPAGGHQLTDAGRRQLEPALAYLALDASVRGVVVEGYSDASGHIRDNYFLSKRRAMEVREYLIDAGVSPDRLQVRFFGESNPVASNATAEGRARNRRVQVRLLRDPISRDASL